MSSKHRYTVPYIGDHMGGPPCTTRTKCLARSLIKQFCDASRLLAAKAKFHSSMKFSSKQKSHQSPCSFLPSSFAGKPTSRKSGGGEGGGRRIYDEFSRDSRSTEKGKWALKCHLRRSNRLFPSFFSLARSDRRKFKGGNAEVNRKCEKLHTRDASLDRGSC